jgi:hypothetical protein
MSKSLHLSPDLKTVVSRLFSDSTFKEEALREPELAFAHYSLDADERKALKSLMGHFHRGKMFSADIGVQFFWF